jgi:hypothetical protein
VSSVFLCGAGSFATLSNGGDSFDPNNSRQSYGQTAVVDGCDQHNLQPFSASAIQHDA